MTDTVMERDPSSKTPEGQGAEIPLGWKPTATQPVPVMRCVQVKKDGYRCKQWSLRGYTKCYRHAGPGRMPDGNVRKYADAIIEAARLQIVEDTDKAVSVLRDFISQPGTSEAIKLKAATEILDRAGVRGGFDLNVEVQVTENPADAVTERLTALRQGALAVQKMKDETLREQQEEHEIIDGEVIEHTDEQGTLF